MANTTYFGTTGTGSSNSWTYASSNYQQIGYPTGNLNVSGTRIVIIEGISVNGLSGAYAELYSNGELYIIRTGSPMYFTRYLASGYTIYETGYSPWENSSLYGYYTWSTVPAAIGTPTATASTTAQGTVALSWTAPSNGGASITNYRIFYETSATGTGSWSGKTEITKSSSTSTSYTATGLTVGTYYRFYVSAVNSRGTAAYSTVSAVRQAPGNPGAPTGLTCTTSTSALGAIVLSWTAPSVVSSGITGYSIYATPAGGTRTKIASTTGDGTGYTATGLTQRLNYTFDVAARSAFSDTNSTQGTSSSSVTRQASGVATAPQTVAISTPVDYALKLTWAAPSDGAPTVTGYIVFRADGTVVDDTLSSSTLEFTESNLVPGQTYSYYVTAKNALSTSLGIYGIASSQVSAIPTGSPQAPTSVTATADTAVVGAINLSWGPTAGTVSANIYTNTEPKNLVATVQGTSYRIYGLTPGIPYSYIMTTNNLYGVSGFSNVATATPVGGSTQSLGAATSAVVNNTNTNIFNGTFAITSTSANTITYDKTYSGSVSEVSVSTINDGISNLTNDNISITNVAISTSGPTASQFSYTKAVADGLGDFTAKQVSAVTATNLTNTALNGTFTVPVSGGVDAGAKTISYELPASVTNISTVSASGTVVNNSNDTYNGTSFIIDAVTENTFTYDAATTGNTDQETTASNGLVTNLTNQNVYNFETKVISSSSAYNSITYTAATGTGSSYSTQSDVTVNPPYGEVRKSDSTAKLEVQYRSGWLG